MFLITPSVPYREVKFTIERLVTLNGVAVQALLLAYVQLVEHPRHEVMGLWGEHDVLGPCSLHDGFLNLKLLKNGNEEKDGDIECHGILDCSERGRKVERLPNCSLSGYWCVWDDILESQPRCRQSNQMTSAVSAILLPMTSVTDYVIV